VIVAASVKGNYVSSVTAAATTGIISIEFKQVAPGKVDSSDAVTLNPVTVVSGVLAWGCSSASIDPGIVSANCR